MTSPQLLVGLLVRGLSLSEPIVKAYSLSPIVFYGPNGGDLALTSLIFLFPLTSMILIHFSQLEFALRGAAGI